jgi:tetratricopeptide (TPR) repeat protein
MNCQRVITENLIERYLQGTLEPSLRDDFEDHYFACESCLAQVQTVQAIKPVLANMPPPAPAKRSWAPLPWFGLAAAALALFLIFWPKPSPSPGPVATLPLTVPAPPALLLLSEVQPAPYSPALFRDGAGAPGPAFSEAMRSYQKGEWNQAAQSLAAVAENSPSNFAALHFVGISSLLAGKSEAALAFLDRVIAFGQQSPFEEEARFYRAQTLLLLRRSPEARQELERIIKARGDYEAPARSLLKRL